MLVEPFDLDALHFVARVDVRAQSGVVADARHEEEHARVTAIAGVDAHGHHDVGPLLFDAARELRDVGAGERAARQAVDVAAKAGTEVVGGKAEDLDRLDARAVGGFGVLRGHGSGGHAKGAEQTQDEGSHDRPKRQAARHSTSC